MSMTYLGATLDIHGGGQDLIFPHHENEIAQSEASTGETPFSRYWVHNGLLQLGQDKMSKSLGNLVSVEEALESYSPDAIRLYFLSSHYRSPLSYSDEGCDSMERSADRLRNVLREQVDSDGAPMDPAPFQEQFIQGMDDDLNTPKALAAMFDLSHEINRQRDAGNSISAAQDCLRHLGSLLGLTFQERYVSLNLDAGLYNAMVKDIHSKLLASGQAELSELFGETPATNVDTVSGPDIDRLVHIRTECRTYKLYALADEIRNWLESQGVSVEDSAAGSIWSYRPGP
tara:strand:+ start:91 stop:951 length:861 start_codon:yes stop_codon:yes gene_type:complete